MFNVGNQVFDIEKLMKENLFSLAIAIILMNETTVKAEHNII